METSFQTMPDPGTELASLLRTGHPILDIATHETAPSPTAFDNRKSWDNWAKTGPKRFDNRPTWDNWKKR
ncbi:hypothetical protein G5C66_10515 [Nocardioides sp. KC13]|uniref:Uncharacterized protein n=1 Tax=Nocardioides turkmenicus TaxID=2711220 RepID=A0A6M1R9U1_9ACTN|nr:multiple cyclophane-containing RiPP AmcA [Nocardioides sp. KC13]NGN93167.1 hypothetical protein [Nocardioides sp. KC13]